MFNVDVKVRRTKKDRQKNSWQRHRQEKNESPKLFNSPRTSVQSKWK